ncbi:MAG: hypothetical protein HZA62_09875 [Rhodocyclales bacterium]|nr:hypothetical protein [Rhodocyclales bacterium]
MKPLAIPGRPNSRALAAARYLASTDEAQLNPTVHLCGEIKPAPRFGARIRADVTAGMGMVAGPLPDAAGASLRNHRSLSRNLRINFAQVH